MTPAQHIQIKRILAWAIFLVFVAGFFDSPIGLFTGPILGLWLVGTQRPLRGAVWFLATNLVLGVPGSAIHALATHQSLLPALGATVALAILQLIPVLFHRLVSPWLPSIISTLAYPTALVSLIDLLHHLTAEGRFQNFLTPFLNGLLHPWLASLLSPVEGAFLVFLPAWIAALVLWTWNNDLRRSTVLGSVVALLVLVAFTWSVTYFAETENSPINSLFYGLKDLMNYIFANVALLACWALAAALRRAPAAFDLGALRTPSTREPLRREGRYLVSASGLRVPLRQGIPDFRTAGDLTGLNGKYNRLYQFIGGFYDDTQRVVGPMLGFDRDVYVHSYLDFLEVKPGDRVLETSVGTGLNFKYLPQAIERYGLDLSDGMLDAARANLARWRMPATLVLGNAERLPFADASFDVVFHVGGINFFSDRAAAIREMIRVARPGSKLLIADETEEHVQTAYEKGPITNAFYRNRPEAVKPPVDLLPPEMEEVHLETLNVVGKNRFYALTFRKPVSL